MFLRKYNKEDFSFSEEKEAKRLLSIKIKLLQQRRHQWINVLWFFLSRKNNPSSCKPSPTGESFCHLARRVEAARLAV